jgi:hypothetical protein
MVTGDDADTRLVRDILELENGPGSIGEIGARLLDRVVGRYRARGDHPREVILALARLASSPAPNARDAGNALIFAHLVEPLSDAFDPGLAEVYDAVFAQIIDHQRRQEGGAPIDLRLARFGLRTEADILRRRRRLRSRKAEPLPLRIRKAIVLSRVTVGADVAVTSVILGRLRQVWPDAGIVLVAPPRMAEFFAGDPRIRVRPAPYPRRGSLLDRLSTWVALLDALREEESEDSPDVVYVDPDSRLTQLGLLPLGADEGTYRIFESRVAGAGGDACLGSIASSWALDTFGGDPAPAWPYLRLDPKQVELARAAVRKLRGEPGCPIVSVSFGVGGNPAKRSGEAFEAGFVRELIRRGRRIVLDLGIESDRDSSDRLVGILCGQGLQVRTTDESGISRSGEAGRTDILAWDGGPGLFAALIGASDAYAGYDSAFQHVAAALAVSLVTIVRGAPGPVFRARWTPWSRTPVRIVSDDLAGPMRDPERLVAEALAAIEGSFG